MPSKSKHLRTLFITACLAGSGASGCATLEVQMDVLNPIEAERIRYNSMLDKSAYNIVEAEGGATDAFLNTEYERRQAIIDQYAQIEIEKGIAKVASMEGSTEKKARARIFYVEGAKQFRDNFKTEQWDRIVAKHRAGLQDNEYKIRGRALGLMTDERPDIRLELRQLMEIRTSLISHLDDSLISSVEESIALNLNAPFVTPQPALPAKTPEKPSRADTDTENSKNQVGSEDETPSTSGTIQLAGASTAAVTPPAVVAPVAPDAEQSETEEKLKRNLKSIIPGQSLSNSDYAYAVMSADDHQWQEKFNHAKGNGRFGNSDIAIKLDSSGNFTVKGMQFDPSTVATIAAKVGTQSLLIATQLAGVPSTYSGDNLLAGQTTTNAVGQMEKTIAEREAWTGAYKDSIRYLARTVLSQETVVLDDDPIVRKRGNEAVQSQLSAYDALFTPKQEP